MAQRGTNEKSLARSLGEFFGHIRAGIKAKPTDARERREVSRTVDEETVDSSRGKVTLRRTVIEEIDLPRDDRRDKR
jgi:hypothetical protein